MERTDGPRFSSSFGVTRSHRGQGSNNSSSTGKEERGSKLVLKSGPKCDIWNTRR